MHSPRWHTQCACYFRRFQCMCVYCRGFEKPRVRAYHACRGVLLKVIQTHATTHRTAAPLHQSRLDDLCRWILHTRARKLEQTANCKFYICGTLQIEVAHTVFQIGSFWFYVAIINIFLKEYCKMNWIAHVRKTLASTVAKTFIQLTVFLRSAWLTFVRKCQKIIRRMELWDAHDWELCENMLTLRYRACCGAADGDVRHSNRMCTDTYTNCNHMALTKTQLQYYPAQIVFSTARVVWARHIDQLGRGVCMWC